MTLPQKQLHIHSQNQDQNDSIARAFLDQPVFILKLRAVPPPSRQPLLLPTVGSNFVLYLLAYSPDLSKEWDPDLWPPQLSNYGQGKSDEGKWDFFPPPGLQTSLWERSWLVRTFFHTPAGGKQYFGSGQAPNQRNKRKFSWLCPFAKPTSTNYLKERVTSAGPWLSSFGYQTDRWSASVAPDMKTEFSRKKEKEGKWLIKLSLTVYIWVQAGCGLHVGLVTGRGSITDVTQPPQPQSYQELTGMQPLDWKMGPYWKLSWEASHQWTGSNMATPEEWVGAPATAVTFAL